MTSVLAELAGRPPQGWTYEVQELSEGHSGIVYDETGQAVIDHLSDADVRDIVDHSGWWQRRPFPADIAEESGYQGAFGWIKTYRLNDIGLKVQAVLRASLLASKSS